MIIMVLCWIHDTTTNNDSSVIWQVRDLALPGGEAPDIYVVGRHVLYVTSYNII